MNDKDKTQLGKILLKRKLANSKDLTDLIAEKNDGQKHADKFTSGVLEKGRSELKALSEQAGVPAVNLDEMEIELKNLEILPHEIAAQHIILPVITTEDSVNLVMANPDDQRVIDEIEFVSGKKVFPHVALHAQIVEFVEACYEAKNNGETFYRGDHFDKKSELDTVKLQDEESSLSAGAIFSENKYEQSNDEDFGIDIELEISETGNLSSVGDVSHGAFGASGKQSLSIVDKKKKKILVVDDEDDIRLLISRVLTEKNYKVVTAGRGLEAISMVQTENPDMIVLDAMLPEVHGFDICKKIKGSKKYGHIPVIMISAIYRGWRYAQDLKNSYGVDEFIEKPFKIGEFIEKVEKHMSASTAQDTETTEDLSLQTEQILSDSIAAYKSGDIEKAIKLLRNGLDIDPLAFKLHYNLALLLGKKSLNYQAIRELESALELSPDYFPAMKNLALLYQKAGFKFKSIETWERALHYCPDEETRDNIKRHLVNLL